MSAEGALDGGRNNPEDAAKFSQQIREFMDSEEKQLVFPPTLTSDDRKIIHDICYELDLTCRSRGPKKDGRFITIFKPEPHELEKLRAQKTRALERAQAEAPTAEAAAAAPSAKRQKIQEQQACAIGPEFTTLKLAGITDYNHDSKIFEFALPEGRSLALPVCACILLKGKGADGADAVRPYTPVSDNSMLGKFQLLIKKYDAGVVSSFIHGLKVGDTADFKHIPFNVKIQYPFRTQGPTPTAVKTVSMLCGGTGIAPMYQALQRMNSDPANECRVTCLYGNNSVADILLREELDSLAKSSSNLTVHHVLGTAADAPKPEGWSGEVGWIDEEKIKRLCFPPAADTLVFVCGLPAMYESLCGPCGESVLIYLVRAF